MKLTSSLEIRAKKNKKTGVIEVVMYADKVKIWSCLSYEGSFIGFGNMIEPVLLQNGLTVVPNLKFYNIVN